MMRPTITLLVVLALGACHNTYEARDPEPMQPVAAVPAQDALQVAADEDAARREAEAEAAPVEPAGPPPVPEADKTFVMDAAMGGIAEVELSKVALAGAKKSAIKELAQRMIDDHGKANEELAALVGARGLELPKDPDQPTLDRKTALEKQKGTKLEKAYLDHMLADHRKAVELFRTQSQNGVDPEIREWATRTLPKLEDHLSHVEAVASGKPHKPKEVALATPSATR
jgi:putative membrane protein